MRSSTAIKTSVWLLFAIALLSCNRQEQPVRVNVSEKFEAMWWSEQQMDGMNPNSPPPKSTRVTLTKWEYSDPIAVPHPDSVDLTVEVTNLGDKLIDDLTVQGTGQWVEGPIKDKQAASPSSPWPLETQQAIRLGAGETKVVRIPIDLASKMKALSPSRWPWELRTEIRVLSANNKATVVGPLARTLPITPGD